MKFVNVNDEYEKFPQLKDFKGEILKIQEWVKQQPHLPDLEEREIIVFFHAHRYHTEKTKQVIDLHYTTRTLCPELFSYIDPLSAEIRQAMKTVSIAHLPRKTPQGHKVIIGKLSDFDIRKFNHIDSLKLYSMGLDVITASEGIASSFEIVSDLSGVTLGHVARIEIMNLKKFIIFFHEAQSVKISRIHAINLVPFTDKILATFRPFLNEEILKKLHLHSNIDSFYKYVPKEILPVDYGGNEESMEILKDKFYKNIIDNRDYILNQKETKRVNEKLRPGKPKNTSDLFGMEGNFKKLVID